MTSLRGCSHDPLSLLLSPRSYLVVHVNRAVELQPVDESGLVDSFVTIEWGGQRLSTRVQKRSLEPVYNETLYFLIKSFKPGWPGSNELSKSPYATLSVWSYMEGGGSQLLGTQRLYLHDITGRNKTEDCGPECHQMVPSKLRIRLREAWWGDMRERRCVGLCGEYWVLLQL